MAERLTVDVRKRKWPDRLASRWAARVLGTDGFGTWLRCAAGTPHFGADGAAGFRMPGDGVQLMPATGWWTAWWWADGAVTVDICTPPSLDADGWSYLDLEVDLVRRGDGTVLVVDEDEFHALGELPPGFAAAVAAETVRIRTMLADPAAAVLREGWARLTPSRG